MVARDTKSPDSNSSRPMIITQFPVLISKIFQILGATEEDNYRPKLLVIIVQMLTFLCKCTLFEASLPR
jgi:hypothetical protein